MATEVNPSKIQSDTPDPLEQTRSGQFFRPDVDIVETPDELLVLADMPGLGTDLIDIRFEDGTLTIHGRVPSRQPADVRFLLREYAVGDFFRTFRVSENIDASRITADYSGGVLTLHLPKSEKAKPRKIAVQAK
jgi:HSP20 family protein